MFTGLRTRIRELHEVGRLLVQSLRLASALLAWGLFAAAAHAYPEKELLLVNAYPLTGPAEIAGSSATNKLLRATQLYVTPPLTDVLALRVAQTLNVALNTPVSIMRKSRARSLQGHLFVAKSPPDGHTLLLSGTGPMLVYPQVLPVDTFDPMHDFAPVARLARMPVALIAHESLAAHNVERLIALARAAPPSMLAASSGDFSVGHLAMHLFAAKTGVRLEHVAYNGGNAAMGAVAARQIGIAFVPLPAALSHLGERRIKALAVAEAERFPTLPDVPTFIEAGVGDFEVAAWFGLFAPARTPRRIVAHLGKELAKGLQSEQTRRLFLSQGIKAAYLAHEDFRRLLRAEHEKWAPLIDAVERKG